MSSLFVIAA